MHNEIEVNYDAFYRVRDPHHVYPVEFVVRALLGNYPRHTSHPSTYRGQRVLDLGFGDGRNMPLLYNQGMDVFGVEISKEICELTAARMKRLGIAVDLQVGRNASIPFEDGFFDRVLACHACYYVDPGARFEDNLREIARVMRPGGEFIFSAPIGTSYIFSEAQDTGDGHMRISKDPYGVRNGTILKKFDRAEDIEEALSPVFDEITIGSCRNDFWGIEEHVWIVICSRSRSVHESI